MKNSNLITHDWIVIQLTKKFEYRNHKFITIITKACHCFLSLDSFSINFKIIISFMPRSPNQSLHFSDKILYCNQCKWHKPPVVSLMLPPGPRVLSVFCFLGIITVPFDTPISCTGLLRDWWGGCSSWAPILSNCSSVNTQWQCFGSCSYFIDNILNSISVRNSHSGKLSSKFPQTVVELHFT
jgi:hypothetical protein